MTPVPPVDAALLEDATDIAAHAAAHTLTRFGRADLHVESKRDGSEVTDADRGAEEIVRREVRARHPDDTVIGEEFGTTTGSSGRRWIVDPIDGTTSFVHGVPLYSSLLAVFDEHGPAVGVITIPALDRVCIAGRGRGCTVDGRPSQVAATADLAGALISTSSFDLDWWPTDALVAIASCGAKTRTWGDGYGYLLLASGAIDVMIDPPLNPWDIAAMLTVIPEAGGMLTTWAGTADPDAALDERPAGWVAANATLHRQVLDLVAPTVTAQI
ncbi:MAG: inositol monophosphatase family protein [Acidimicrobiales bacterium]